MGRPGKKAERLSVEDDFIATPIMDHNQSVNITAENLYSNSVSIDRRKKLGQFFTPNSIANIMTDWIASINPKNIIDPAIGTGVFLRSVNAQLSSEYNFDSFDIDPLIASFIPKDIPTARYRVRIQDFLTAKIDKNYDAAIMNPPYLRHHDMLYDIDIHSYISSLIKKPISKLANSYMLFVIRACHLLKVGGRGAFIIPTEWSNANFGKALKEYLIDTGLLRHIIYFSNCSDVFSDALTTACILLVEKTQRNSDQVDVTYVEGAKIPFNFNSISEINSGFVSKKIDAKTLRNASKWDYLIRRGDIQEIPGFVNLSQLACTKRGIATGANDFFHLSSERVRQLGISDKNLISCIGQARDVRGLSFTKKDFASLCNEGKRTKLVSFSGSINGREAAYIAHGENLNLHRRYLLSKRNPWYSMEVRPPSPIWAAVFGRKELRFILNEALVANLTTFHSVYPHDTSPSFCKALTVCLNSRLVQEMAQSNMRVYGGGC